MRGKIEYSMLLQNVSKTRAKLSWQRGPPQGWTPQVGMDLQQSPLLELASREQPDGEVPRYAWRLPDCVQERRKTDGDHRGSRVAGL